MQKYVFFGLFVFVACSGDSRKTNDIGAKTGSSPPNNNIVDIPVAAGSPNGGEFIKRYANGIIEAKGYYANGWRDGQWVSFFRSGKVWSEVMYSEGKKNGQVTSWYENGNKRYEGAYSNDSLNGIWVFWDETGKQVKTIDYNIRGAR